MSLLNKELNKIYGGTAEVLEHRGNICISKNTYHGHQEYCVHTYARNGEYLLFEHLGDSFNHAEMQLLFNEKSKPYGVMENIYDLWITAVIRNGVSISGKTEKEFRDEGMIIKPYEDCLAQIEITEANRFVGKWEKIDEEQFNYSFEALPPIRYRHERSVEFYASSEPYSGNIHYHYAHVGKHYYRALRSITTPVEELISEALEML